MVKPIAGGKTILNDFSGLHIGMGLEAVGSISFLSSELKKANGVI
jgi:hypothetical protein